MMAAAITDRSSHSEFFKSMQAVKECPGDIFKDALKLDAALEVKQILALLTQREMLCNWEVACRTALALEIMSTPERFPVFIEALLNRTDSVGSFINMEHIWQLQRTPMEWNERANDPFHGIQWDRDRDDNPFRTLPDCMKKVVEIEHQRVISTSNHFTDKPKVKEIYEEADLALRALVETEDPFTLPIDLARFRV